MARKHLKTFMFYDEDSYHVDKDINSWLDDKAGQIGKTIARFEVLDIKLSTSNSKEYEYIVVAMIIYTELRL
tara:strand:+ start:734 stop:949 length:216 start_codon:yes stop_codon:yes gene_type:complete